MTERTGGITSFVEVSLSSPTPQNDVLNCHSMVNDILLNWFSCGALTCEYQVLNKAQLQLIVRVDDAKHTKHDI